MSGPTPNQDIFDVRKIRRLVELMKEHDLSEIDLQQGEVRIQLRRAATAAAAGGRRRAGGCAAAGCRRPAGAESGRRRAGGRPKAAEHRW